MRSRRLAGTLLLGAALIALCAPAAAQAGFGVTEFEAAAKRSDGSPETRAGGHPFSFETRVGLDTEVGARRLRDLTLHLAPGLLVNPPVINTCSEAAFHTPRVSPYEASASGESCPNQSQVGVVEANVGGTSRWFGLFSLEAPYGSVAALGASPLGAPLIFRAQLREADSGLDLVLGEVPQSLDLRSLELTVWGTPWTAPHSDRRGNCLNEQTGGSWGGCTVLPSGEALVNEIRSYLTLPTTPCGTPPAFEAEASSWSGESAQATATISPLVACNKAKTIPQVQLMTDAAAARTGLAFNLAVNDGGGITNPAGIARPAVKTAVLSLPEGLTINPSLGGGLGTCSESEWARETATSEPGAGCPNSSKIGAVVLEGALALDEPLRGALYLATPYANPSHSLIHLYMLVRLQRRGMIVKSQGRAEPDPRTGRLVVTYEDLPRLLYTHLTVTLREGLRSTLVSPPTCGTYRADMDIASWAAPTAFARESSYFAIKRGEGGASCPSGGAPPFAPGLTAGSINPAAGAQTPLYLRMSRGDGEQEITSYSADFPPGLLGKIAGVPLCPDAALAAAARRSGFEEQASPSCPAQSSIGHTIAGFGVGGTLAWAPGGLYLAGPYHGAPLSVVAIDAATIGPFDLGTVIVRQAVRVDPRSARVSLDPAGSDPIPHILAGIPLHLRDIRVYIDRPDFMVNPTSCDPMQISSRLGGAGADAFSAADDTSAGSTQRYQVLGCSALGFRPRLHFNLSAAGKSRRFPALRSEYTPRPGDANTRFVSVTLPRSLFVAQSHLRQICTKVQFANDACPAEAIYGHARATSPLLDAPMEGNVYLRSAGVLPDIVFALRGQGGIRVDVVGHIDTVHGATRVTFNEIPDAPVSKFVLNLRSGRGSLLELTRNACSAEQLASVRMVGHNNLGATSKPAVKVRCEAKAKKEKKGPKAR